MTSAIRDTYLETQVTTATPQRLHLMLIDEALRRARAAQAAWQAGNDAEAVAAISHCREIVAELIAGVQPEQTPLATQVLGIYVFLFSTLVEAQFGRDERLLVDVIRVLDEERQTWQAVCEQMPEKPAAANVTTPTEELAPQRVPHAFSAGYGQPSGPARIKPAASAFSIEA